MREINNLFPTKSWLLVIFFNKGLNAYAWSLDSAQFSIVRAKNIKLAAFRLHNGYFVTPEVGKYKNLIIIPIDLK